MVKRSRNPVKNLDTSKIRKDPKRAAGAANYNLCSSVVQLDVSQDKPVHCLSAGDDEIGYVTSTDYVELSSTMVGLNAGSGISYKIL